MAAMGPDARTTAPPPATPATRERPTEDKRAKAETALEREPGEKEPGKARARAEKASPQAPRCERVA